MAGSRSVCHPKRSARAWRRSVKSFGRAGEMPRRCPCRLRCRSRRPAWIAGAALALLESHLRLRRERVGPGSERAALPWLPFVVTGADRAEGILVAAQTTISTGDTVRWTMASTPHTVSSGPTGGPNVACGTGDLFDSGTANAFTPGFVFTHQFNTPGTCHYYCIIHPTVMFGDVIVAGGTTTTVATTTSTVTNRSAGSANAFVSSSSV